MSVIEDLIDFELIEVQKENIQSLPQGRSAKALASAFGQPSLFSPIQTPGATRNLNDAIRQEYELELLAISDSDDPLDIYDRYIKWTLNAYPSAQATQDSQLRPLLERATKAFQSIIHYKNDPRYLKIWLNYIRFFSDTPKETFAYLARHNIGEGLALFYEEFAAWLEGAGRWNQAEEVFKLGMEREARPAERLLRKFGEFQQRYQQRPQDDGEPSSPAIPTVRPALVAKLDPFASSTPRSTDPQAQRLPVAPGTSSTSRGGRQKLAIFSDTDASQSATKLGTGGTTKGWDNIGSIQERKKENTIEARPWAGETLKISKKAGAVPKLMIFKDGPPETSPESNIHSSSIYADQQQTVNPRTGKTERVFVNLEAVYPNPEDHDEEYSFEELRAKHRGWLHKSWIEEKRFSEVIGNDAEQLIDDVIGFEPDLGGDATFAMDPKRYLNIDIDAADHTLSDSTTTLKEGSREGREPRQRKKKVMEVKVETQTVKANLESPTGPKLKRKNSGEPTMTINTRAATNDILDIFNQPLRNMGLKETQADSAGESDYDDDDYTSAGESTGTGRISGTSDFGDEDTGIRTIALPDSTEMRSESQWSEFTASKHVPDVDRGRPGQREKDFKAKDDSTEEQIEELVQNLVTPVSPKHPFETTDTRYIPIPPENYEPPTHPYRDPLQVSQSKLPFMTPIVEKTESSVGVPTIRGERDYFTSKTPSRKRGNGTPVILELDDNLLSSPFQEIINEAKPARAKVLTTKDLHLSKGSGFANTVKGPIIKDLQCNPVDEAIRTTILESIQPPLSSFPGFHDYRPQVLSKGPEIRRFVKALGKISKNTSDKTTTNLSLPPCLHFPSASNTTFTVKRELGKGAYAPVYLAYAGLLSPSDSETPNSSTSDIAIKAELPPTPWEFYIMTTAHARLPPSNPRATESILQPYAFHLFADEGYLLEAYHSQGTLLDAVNTAKASPASTSSSGSNSAPPALDEPLVMFFAIELLRTVEALHSEGLLHGDLKADNCLVRLPALPDPEWSATYCPHGDNGWSAKGITLIDFGRGIDMRAFSDGVQFIADWKTTRQDCVEMREMRPWTYSVDYWGLAGIVHVLLFGKWIEDVVVVEKPPSPSASHSPSAGLEIDGGGTAGGVVGDEHDGVGGGVGVGGRVELGFDVRDADHDREQSIGSAARKRYRPKEALKRYWATDIWTHFFDVLLNPARWVCGEQEAKMPVTNRLRAVRKMMEDWLVENGERRGLKVGLRRLEEAIREKKR